MRNPIKINFKHLLLTGMCSACLFSMTSANAEDEREENEATESHGQKTDSQFTEGSIIKVKTHKNEIYIRTSDGSRKEIYLENGYQIIQGTKTLKLEDLKKDMRVRVTGRNKIEILN